MADSAALNNAILHRKVDHVPGFPARNPGAGVPAGAPRQPPRPGRRRHRHGQDRHADDDRRGLLAHGRAGVHGRCEGRRGRPGDAGRDERQAAGTDQGHRHRRLRQRSQSGGVLGPVRQERPSGAHHRERDRAYPALAHPRVERHPERRARHRLQARRRPRPAPARSRRPARPARARRGRAQGHLDLLRPGQRAVDRRNPARAAAPGAGRRRDVLRRAGARTRRPDAHHHQRPRRRSMSSPPSS